MAFIRHLTFLLIYKNKWTLIVSVCYSVAQLVLCRLIRKSIGGLLCVTVQLESVALLVFNV